MARKATAREQFEHEVARLAREARKAGVTEPELGDVLLWSGVNLWARFMGLPVVESHGLSGLLKGELLLHILRYKLGNRENQGNAT